MCYVPMYLENVLMSGLVLWSVSTTPSPAWYIVPGCVCYSDTLNNVYLFVIESPKRHILGEFTSFDV